MEAFNPATPLALPYRVFRVWGEFWQDQDLSSDRIPPLYHYGRASNCGAFIIAPCSVDEVKAFIASRPNDDDLTYRIETGELGSTWIGHWCLFVVHLRDGCL
jgi:hypothetical protein